MAFLFIVITQLRSQNATSSSRLPLEVTICDLKFLAELAV
jgi:hypothetical protein